MIDLINPASPSYDTWVESEGETEDSLIKPVFTVSNGELTISNGNHEIVSAPKAVSFVNKLYMQDTSIEFWFQKWVVREAIPLTVSKSFSIYKNPFNVDHKPFPDIETI